jgi:NAD dependent epimerase/dehydratase family enzyme
MQLLTDDRASGPVNLTAPEPVTNARFTKALGRALSRPTVLPVPAFALRLALGELSSVLLTGQRAVPERARELGYVFRYPTVDDALAAALHP